MTVVNMEYRCRRCRKERVKVKGHLCKQCWWDKLRHTIEKQGMIHVADRRGHYWIDPLEMFFEIHGRHPDRQPIEDEDNERT